MRIAEAISAHLDREELAAQGMFPHYFEKQKTDGVDYQIYVGPSLLEDGRVDPMCLKNLRLWQLMLTCGIAVRARQIRDQLPVPLETTHLILVQHTPLSIVASADAEAAWAELSTAQKLTIIAALCVVVLHPSGQGARKFDPGTVTFRTQCKLSHFVEV